MIQQIQNAVTQVLIVLVLSAIFFLIRTLLKKSPKMSYWEFVGLKLSGLEISAIFILTLAAFAALGAVHTYLSVLLDSNTLALLKSDSSPYGVIIRSSSQYKIIFAFIYCYIQAGLAEEILFRGLIAKRLYYYFGFMIGNILQALIFWVIHATLMRFVSGVWISYSQLSLFVFIMLMSLIFGYYNEKVAKGSIIPSWLFHGTANFATFLVLLSLASKIT